MKRWLLCAFFVVGLATGAWASEIRTVEYVIDGDTVVLDHHQKARLIGVDTPELKDVYRNMRNAYLHGADTRRVNAYAALAKNFTKALVQGRTVRVEFGGERTDQYGRLLVYLYRLPDDIFLNAELIKQGCGFAYTRFPFKYSEDFKRYEEQAKAARCGLWQ